MQYNFLDWKWSPPLFGFFSENSSDLVAWPVPNPCSNGLLLRRRCGGKWLKTDICLISWGSFPHFQIITQSVESQRADGKRTFPGSPWPSVSLLRSFMASSVLVQVGSMARCLPSIKTERRKREEAGRELDLSPSSQIFIRWLIRQFWRSATIQLAKTQQRMKICTSRAKSYW